MKNLFFSVIALCATFQLSVFAAPFSEVEDPADESHYYNLDPNYQRQLLEEDDLFHPNMYEQQRRLKKVLLVGWEDMVPMKYKANASIRKPESKQKRLARLGAVLEESRITIDDRKAAIIVPFNAGWLDMAKHVDCSLKAAGITNVFYWALDEEAAVKGRKHGLATYYDRRFKSTVSHAGIGTPDYLAMMRQRPRFWLDILNSGYDMIFLDADIVVLQDVVQFVENKIQSARQAAAQKFKEYTVPDIIMQIDEKELIPKESEFRWTAGCAGFFYMRSTEGMKDIMRLLALFLDLFADMTSSGQYTSEWWHWNDQTGLMMLLHETAQIIDPNGNSNGRVDASIRLEFFSQFDMANGHIMWDYTKRRAMLAEHSKKYGANSFPVLVHANGQSDKQKAFTKLNLGFFEDWKTMTCKTQFNTQQFLRRVNSKDSAEKKSAVVNKVKAQANKVRSWFHKQYTWIKKQFNKILKKQDKKDKATSS